MQIFRVTTFAIAASLAFSGCTPKKEAPKSALVTIKGDPRVFIAGTIQNKTSTLREAMLDTNAYYEVSLNGFENTVTERTFEEAKGKQDPNGKASAASKDEGLTQAESGSTFYRLQHEGDVYILKPTGSANFTFRFVLENGLLRLKKIETKSGIATAGSDFDILHYSSSPDGNKNSILIYGADGKSQFLLNIYFHKVATAVANLDKTDAPFNYMLGRGVKTIWRTNEPVPMQICGSLHSTFSEAVKNAVKEWNVALQGRLQLRSFSDGPCPPFSDVNTHTFNVIQGWIEIPGPDAMKEAITTFTYDTSTGSIIGSDIFFIMKEWQEVVDKMRPGLNVMSSEFLEVPAVREHFFATLRHEVGHFVGLHHTFNGPPSIMDYDEEIKTIQEHDRSAVQALYPLNPLLRERLTSR